MTYAVLFDANRCIGCRGCQAACKQWNNNDEIAADGKKVAPTVVTGTSENPPHLSSHTWTKMAYTELEYDNRFHWIFTKRQCMHCEHPACAAACPVAALRKTPQGPVIYDEKRCIGCRYCMVACPFGVPTFEWDKPVPWIRKCTFCEDRLGAGIEPACVKTCPPSALLFGERDELISLARERIKAAPQKYVDHIYGEKEVGGTSWMYLSPVPFEKIGLPVLGDKPVTLNAERAMGAVPPVLLGVAAAAAGIYWIIKRRDKIANEKPEESKEEQEK